MGKGATRGGMGNRKNKRQGDRLAELVREKRRLKAYELYGEGKSSHQIGAELGISHVQALKDIRTVAAGMSNETRAEQRARSTATLETLRRRIMPLTCEEAGRTVADRCTAARTVIREVAVHARLNGLERPIQIELAPTGTRDAYDDLVSAITTDGEEVRDG